MKQRVPRSLLIGLTCLLFVGCPGITIPGTGSPNFDGTYNFFFKYPSPSGQTSRSLSRYLIINNGVVSSSDNNVTGSVDHFGAVRFQSPCPINSSTATWTGNMNASAQAGSNFGQGTYTCTIAIGGGSLDSWQATQTQ